MKNAAATKVPTTILSLTIPEKLARKVRLLSKVENVTISSIFLGAAEKEISERLKAALAVLETEMTDAA